MVATKRRAQPSPLGMVGVVKKRKSTVPNRTFFEDTLLMTHTRLGLSQNAIGLLEKLDEVELGKIEQRELGRMIRLSPRLRKAILDTITKCSDMIVEIPSEGDECSRIIHKCTEMLDIAERPSETTLPFLKLPAEIRNRIYDLYFGSEDKENPLRRVHIRDPKPACSIDSCPLPPIYYLNKKIDLVVTSKRVHDEALLQLYNKRILYFNCTCSMSHILKTNPIVAANVREIHFHWHGPLSDIAIPMLYQCPELKKLTVYASKMTLYTATKRERNMQTYFRALTTRLVDANGVEELMNVRGLESIAVRQAPIKGRAAATKISEECIWSMERLLASVVMQEKPDRYGE